MKSSRKKRILATILCMVMVLTSNISALAEGDGLPDMTEQGVTAASVPETPVSDAEVPAAETQAVTEQSAQTPAEPVEEPATPEVPATPEPTVESTLEVTPAPMQEQPTEETETTAPGSENTSTEIQGNTSVGDVENTQPTTDTTVPTPEVTPEETGDVFSEETELTQEFKDAQGRVVQKVTAKLPAGAFAAETSHITMEVQYLDEASENHIKNLMTKQLPQGDELGDYIALSVKFKVDGVETEALQPITITFEKSGLEIKDVKKANVFYYDPADPTVAGDQDELVEITQRNEMIENLQAAGQSTDNIEDYDLSSIELKEENHSEKIQFEGRKSTIYGCYVEKTPEEVPVDIPVLNYEDDKVTVSVTAEEAGIIPEGAELKVVPITSEDAETKTQYKEVEKKIQEKVAEEEKEVAGFLAYDITFVDKDGNEMEPNGKVKVSMNYKKAELPQEVEGKKATDAEVTVLHLEEDENGEVKQVVDMAAEQKATVDTLATTEGTNTKVQNVEVETESFSVFTITWTYEGWSKFTITARYVDTFGNEINVENPQTNINFNNNGNTIDLEQYWRTADGYTQEKIRVDDVNGKEITELQRSSEKKGWIDSWTEYYIKYKRENESNYTDWLTAGKRYGKDKRTGTIYFVYESPTANISLNIVDNIIDDGSLTAEISGTYESEISGYEWYSSDSQNGEYTLVEKKNFRGGKTNISDDGTKLYPAFDDGAQKWYKVRVVYADNATVESDPYQVPYFDSLQNGGFEKVVNNRANYVQYSNSKYKENGGVWQTTGTNGGKDIEIINTNHTMSTYYHWYGEATDAETESGTSQFAELNCETAGALYQDVLTMEGQVLNYWLSHRARGNEVSKTAEYDTMYLVVMPTKDAKDLKTQTQLENKLHSLSMEEKYGERHTEVGWNEIYNVDGIYVARITSDDQSWHNILQEGIGKYIPTSSLTRFFFMAGDTDTTSRTEGNFLDAVGFGQELPKPEDGKFNFTIEKHFEGLGNADLEKLINTIQFRISVENNGSQLPDEQVKALLGIKDVVIKGSEMTPDLYGNLSKSFIDRPITNSNNVYEITVTEENYGLASYEVTSSYTTTEKQNGVAGTPGNGDGVTAVVSNIKSKTEATISFTNTYEATNYKNVNFTKVWDDNNNDFGTRPDSLEVTLHGSVSYFDETTGNTVTKELTAEELGVEVTKTLNEAGEWKTSWKVPTYYEITKIDGTAAKIKIHYTVTEGTINSNYVYEAGEIQSGNGEDYETDSFDDVTITGDGQAITRPSAKRLSKGRSLMSLAETNENTLGEPNHRKYVTYNEATGDYTLNLDVTGKKGEAKGVDVLFVIDTSGSMSDYNLLRNVKNLLTKDNGVVDKILGGENNINSVSYVSFAGKSETKTSSWYGANDKAKLKSRINSLRATGGTNWTYAMMKADEKLSERANSGNEKVMIFLSDGDPTYSIKADGSQYGRGNSTREVYYTEAIARVNNSVALKNAQKYSVYLTWDTKGGMSKFATGTGSELVDGTTLETALSDILNKIIPTYTDVSIEDTLSPYVEFTEGNNPTVMVYKDNVILAKNAYTVEKNGKNVKVSFNGELEDGVTYRISFRVKPSQAANNAYVNGGYPDKGDAGTGTTSAGKEGFYSNGEAKLIYSIKGTENNNLIADYQRPVVQITTHSLTFEKQWNKPDNVTIPDSVLLKVAYTDGTNEQITLTKANQWTVTKNNVPVTKKIQSVTESPLADYTPYYEISKGGTKATVINSYSKITTKNMTVKKIWSGNGPESEVTVSLYQRNNDDGAEKIYESVVLSKDNGWTHTWENLPYEEWQEGNKFSYAVREEKIPENYTSNISYKTVDDTTTVTINNVYDTNCADENYYIANKLQTVPLTVTKTWSDGNDAQGERPESLGVTVTEGNHTLQFTLSETNNWTRNVKVPKRNDGNYTATENLAGITSYEQVDSSVNVTDRAVYVSFTNKIQTKSVTVNKVWVDGTLASENRPGSIEFVLKRNGDVYDYYTLSAEDKDENGNSWTKVIEGLPVNGEYTIEETGWGTDESETIYDYNSKVNGFTITNTLNWNIIKTSESLAGEATVNLEGAKFELKKDEKVIATGTSDSTGEVQWSDDQDLTSLNGEYQLVETKAPNGYVLHEEGWTLSFVNGLLQSVTDNKDQKVTNATYDAVKGAYVTVTNTKLYELPETGGTGIFVYTIGGTLLLMAAALLIYKMKRGEVLKG